MIKIDTTGRINVRCADGMWSFEESATKVPRHVFDALRARVEKLELLAVTARAFLDADDDDCHDEFAALCAALAECEEVGRG